MKKILSSLILFTLYGVSGAVFADLPQAPTNQWQYPLIDSLNKNRGTFNRPHIPPFRLSQDGRLGVRIHNKPNKKLSLFLLAPEKINSAFMLSNSGTGILSSEQAWEISPTRLGSTQDGKDKPQNAYFLCEKPTQPNPQACPNKPNNDCYNLTLIGRKTNGNQYHMVGTPITVSVRQPKTKNAVIDSVQLGKTVKGPVISTLQYNEVSVTRDGRLLVTKLNASPEAPWKWTNPNTSQVINHDGKPVVYSYNKNACDVKGWKTLHPVTHAHFDNNVNNRYGFADYQMRDTEGNYINDGQVLETDQYPWIDPQGANIFMALGVDMLLYQQNAILQSRYPTSCVTKNCPLQLGITAGSLPFESTSNVNRNVSFFGRWTHGKLVTIDNLINYMDYGIRGDNNTHLKVNLYQPNSSRKNRNTQMTTTGQVIMAHNKSNDDIAPLGSVTEGAQLGSIDNRLNYLPNLRPKTPRDVVWFFNKGNGGTTELAFDDFIDPNVFIYSPMNQSMAKNDIDGKNGWHDGFDRPTRSSGNGFNGVNPLRLQNAATADASISGGNNFWNIPAYGTPYGNVRVEPYALGGIEGKGFWLDGNSGIKYTIPQQTKRSFDDNSWYYGLFLDPRFEGKLNKQRLLTFPDGSGITLRNTRRLSLTDQNNRAITSLRLPQTIKAEQWLHLGFNITKGNRNNTELTVYVNGMSAIRWTSKRNQPLFNINAGTLSVGADGRKSGFTGWVDEFKVISRALSPEEYCNHARGTLVGLGNRASAAWARTAARYPNQTHNAISAVLRNNGYKTHKKYACYIDYNSEIGANMAQIPTGTYSMRQQILNAKPLVFGQPRPNSSNNAFCLSCHVNGHGDSLSPKALNTSRVNMENDSRRQPMQPYFRIYGNIPANYFGPRKPTNAVRTNKNGAFIDQWLHAAE